MLKQNDNLFLATLWPNNIKNFKNICKMINHENKIIEIKKCLFDINWEKMIRIIYQDDKVSEKSLKRKNINLSKYPKSVIFVSILVKDPKYRYKKNGRKLSTVMENLKKRIREKYGSKMSSTNPIHIVDEVSHSYNLLKQLERMKENNEIKFE